MIFIDSNIPMYAGGAPSKQKRDCLHCLELIAQGSISAVSSAEVLQEILHRYRTIDRLEQGSEVYRIFRELPISYYEITTEDTDMALDLLFRYKKLSSRDALHLGVMKRHRIKKIMTYDQGFLGIPELTVYLPQQL